MTTPRCFGSGTIAPLSAFGVLSAASHRVEGKKVPQAAPSAKSVTKDQSLLRSPGRQIRERVAHVSYSLHIRRPTEDPNEDPTPISLEEWRAAVAVTEGVRLFSDKAYTATVPTTGEVIKIIATEGDAEVFFPSDDRWYPVFRWHEGSAAFNARFFEPGDASHPTWAAAVSLADRVGAEIRGDKGEAYDLQTGQVIKT
jgi:hypothetical protein